MREYVSDYIGMPLLTRGGERIGYVKNVQTDKNLTRVRNLECCDEEEEEFILPLSAIASFGEGATVVKSPAAKGCKNCLPAPIGREAYSTEGAPLGHVRDFGREGALLRTLVLSDGREIDAARIAGVTDTVLVDLSEDFVPKPVARAKRKEKSPCQDAEHACRANADCRADSPAGRSAGGQSASADGADAAEQTARDAGSGGQSASADGAEEVLTVRAAFSPSRDAESEIAADAAETDTESKAPARKAAGRGLLTGKILPQDLLDARGNVLARAGTAVSADVIRTAMRHGKLFELTLLCCASSPFGIWR